MAFAASRLRPKGYRLSRAPARLLERLNRWDESVRRYRPVATIVRFGQAPITRDIEGSRFLTGPAILGTLATLMISIGVCQPNVPFVKSLAGAWFFGVSAHPVGSTQGLFLGLVFVFGGLVLFVRVWLHVMRALRQARHVEIKKLAWLLVLWSLPVIVAPPMFSHDIYSYAAQGEMMSRHISPYLYGPSTLGYTNFTRYVDSWWINTPSPYGPLFLEIAGAFTSISQHNLLADLVLLRLLAFAGVVLIAVSLPTLARSFGRNPATAFGLAVLNPVTILHLIGGAHNDALMVGLLVAGLALAKRNRPVLGIIVCALAASVKVPAAIGIVYIGWDWLGGRVPIRERVRPVITAVLVGGTVMGILSLATGLGWGWVGDLTSPEAIRSWLAPATGSGIVVTGILHLFGDGVALDSVLSVTRVIGVAAALVAGVLLLLRSDKIGPLKAMGLTLLLVVVLGPVVQPWYLSWGLVLLAPVVTGWMRRVLVVLSGMAVFIGLPGGQTLFHDLLYSDPLEIAGALLLLLGIFLAPLGRLNSKPADGIELPALADSLGRAERVVHGTEATRPRATRAVAVDASPKSDASRTSKHLARSGGSRRAAPRPQARRTLGFEAQPVHGSQRERRTGEHPGP